MRFLYADSEPFAPMYDFIGALERFVTHGARVAQLDDEIRVLHGQAEQARQARRKSGGELDEFHTATMKRLEEKLPEGADPPCVEYVRKLTELASHVVEETKSTLAAAEEQDSQTEQREVGRRRAEIRGELEAFLTALRLKVLEVSVSMRLTETKNEMSAVFTHPDQIVTAFTLNAAKLPEWRQPRKVGEFAVGVELPVGVKRGWFSKSVHQERASIDDSIIGSFELEANRSEIRLRRKPAEKDTLAIVLQRADGRLTAEVHYLDDAEAEEQRTALDAAAVANLQRFWDGLLKGLGGAMAEKEKLQSVQFRGADVVEQDQAASFLRAVVALMAPIAAEIGRRTPNAAELILKLEKEGGRREEIYVRKADLAARLEPLAPGLRALFLPLGIIEAPRDSSPSVETGELAADDVLSQAEES